MGSLGRTHAHTHLFYLPPRQNPSRTRFKQHPKLPAVRMHIAQRLLPGCARSIHIFAGNQLRWMGSQDYSLAPAGLLRPVDDGACAHLHNCKIPCLDLAATDGTSVKLATQQGVTVVFCYPMTGRPGVSLPDGWDDIPGARGRGSPAARSTCLRFCSSLIHDLQVVPLRLAATRINIPILSCSGLICMDSPPRPQLISQRLCNACTYRTLSLVTMS